MQESIKVKDIFMFLLLTMSMALFLFGIVMHVPGLTVKESLQYLIGGNNEVFLKSESGQIVKQKTIKQFNYLLGQGVYELPEATDLQIEMAHERYKINDQVVFINYDLPQINRLSIEKYQEWIEKGIISEGKLKELTPEIKKYVIEKILETDINWDRRIQILIRTPMLILIMTLLFTGIRFATEKE